MIPFRLATENRIARLVYASSGSSEMSQLAATSTGRWPPDSSRPRGPPSAAPRRGPARRRRSTMASSTPRTIANSSAAIVLPANTSSTVRERVRIVFQVPWRSSDANRSPASTPATIGNPQRPANPSTTSEVRTPRCGPTPRTARPTASRSGLFSRPRTRTGRATYHHEQPERKPSKSLRRSVRATDAPASRRGSPTALALVLGSARRTCSSSGLTSSSRRGRRPPAAERHGVRVERLALTRPHSSAALGGLASTPGVARATEARAVVACAEQVDGAGRPRPEPFRRAVPHHAAGGDDRVESQIASSSPIKWLSGSPRPRRRQVAEQRAHRPDARRVKAAGRLVQQQQLGTSARRAGYAEALAHPRR